MPQFEKEADERLVSLSHRLEKCAFDACLKKREEEIRYRGDLPGLTVESQLDILRQVAESALGRFLIQNRGLSGYWTDYVLLARKRGELEDVKPFEEFFLKQAPASLATQERLEIFHRVLQKEVREGVVMASVPCGLMSDLLMLDYSGVSDVTLIGSDIDAESIELAIQRAREVQFPGKLFMQQADAWKLELREPVDVLTSNGLNIYESCDVRVVELYRSFFAQIKPGGMLVTSFLTPPPTLDPHSEWRVDQINIEHLMHQKRVLVDTIGVAWQSYRSSEKKRKQLEAAGFVDIEILPDTAFLFPTVIARRLEN